MVYRIERNFQGLLEHALGEDRICEPAVDIYEAKNSLIIEVELPGVNKEDLELYIITDRLYIRAQRSQESDQEKGRSRSFLCLERECGQYYREIEIAVPCKTSLGKARLENGILTVEFEKVEDRRGQRRDLKVE